MARSIGTSTIFLLLFLILLLLRVPVAHPSGIEDAAKTLDRFLETSSRVARDSENESLFWMDYEFNTGTGNREELAITDISIHEKSDLPTDGINWQHLDANGTVYLFGTDESTLRLYKFDADSAAIDGSVYLNIDGTILTYKAFNQYTSLNVVIILCVETNGGILLRWYRLMNEKKFQLFWSWPVQKRIKDMKLIQHEDSNKLLLLNENEMYFGLQYSPIDVYGFTMDFSINSFHFWLSQTTLMPRAFDVQVCSIYEGITVALQSVNGVFLYEYVNATDRSIFQELQTIKSHSLKNFVCFESGYLQFLAISGPEAALFHFEEDEFVFNVESEAGFDFSEISWVKDVKLNTYRDESLLLIQLKNSSVLALAWHGLSFKKIELPNDLLDQFDLASITPLPTFGFVSGNKFVEIHAELKHVKHSSQYNTERLIALQRLLNDSLNHQERILNETRGILAKSYLENPVITGFWNLSTLNATSAVITDDVIFQSVTLGSVNLTRDELELDASEIEDRLRDLQRKIDEIESNNSRDTLHSNSDSYTTLLRLDPGVEITGNVRIDGNLTVERLEIRSINDIDIEDNSDNNGDRDAIEAGNVFDSIEAENLTIHAFNGVPVENIIFHDSMGNYDHVDFSKIKQAHVHGHLSVPTINGFDWETLMRNIVWKNRATLVPGNTIIEGIVTADDVKASSINNLSYPEDYVLKEDDSVAVVTGPKSFDKLLTPRLENVETLNGIDFQDFLILNKDNVLKEEITFENLIVEGPFQIDGEITGLELRKNQLLNETSRITSDVTLINLNVLGNVTFDTLFVSKRPLNFSDLLLKGEENVAITGTKTFLGNVEMRSDVRITSGTVNGHPLDEFATLDTDQHFPNLVKISPIVSFGNVTFGAMKKLEDLFNSTACLKKIVIFKSPVTLDRLSFDKLNNDISYEHFARAANETFRNLSFANLHVNNFYADEITADTVNGMDFVDFAAELKSMEPMDEYGIEELETVRLNATSINGMSLDEIKALIDQTTEILRMIGNGSIALDSLKVTGTIKADSINGVSLNDIYPEDEMAATVFQKDVSIKNFTILGLMNGYNFSERVSDIVIKTETDITIEGYKTFDTINCHLLEANTLNGKPLENIFAPSKEQVLIGPVTINGSMTITKHFNVTGKIGAVSFQDLMNRFKPVGNNTFHYHGDVRLAENVTVENLYSNGSIQGRQLDSFLKSVIRRSEDNVTISGTKVFENLVAFNDAFVVRDKLNDIDLRRFHEKVVYVNEPFSIRTKILFTDGIEARSNLTVKKELDAKSIMDVNINELQLDVLYLDRPTYVEGVTTVINASFLSDISVDTINDLDTKLLIPLGTEQILSHEVLKARNVTVDRLKILGRVNGEDLEKIQDTTFMVTGNQNITGDFHFLGDARMRRNFNPRRLNGMDPAEFISVKSRSTVIGDFAFEGPVYFNQSLRVLSYLNGIDPARWEAVAVTGNNSFRQLISGKWTVFGNVRLADGAYGSDVLNGTNVTDLSGTLARERLEMSAVLEEKNINLESMCQDLAHLKRIAETQVYRFNAFDYLQVNDFVDGVNSVNHFELDDADYLMLSLNSCAMHTYLYTGSRFELVASVIDFGIVEKWTTFRHDRVLYFLTSGPPGCGRNPVNLWRLMNDEFQHVLDLGRNVDAEQLNQDAFSMLLDRKDQSRSADGLSEELRKSLLSRLNDDEVKIVLEDDRMLLTSRRTNHLYDVDRSNGTSKVESLGKHVRGSEIVNFKAGFLRKEMSLYYDEEIGKDRVFICSNDGARRRILQTINAHRPSSFAILNFEGSVETMLVFVENKKNLRMYEYKGIQGFVYRDSIRMDIDKLVSFKIRKYSNLARRYCLAIINANRLTILEAKMYGEKLDMGQLACSEQEEF